MAKIKVFFGKEKIDLDLSEILKDSYNKWGDKEQFLQNLISEAEIIGLAKKDTKIVGFSLAKLINTKENIAIGFLATRVMKRMRNQGIGKSLIKKVTKKFIFKYKIFNLLNWKKSVYLATITANPIVFATLYKYLNIFPSPKRTEPDKFELELAEKFAKVFSNGKIDRDTFVLEKAFLNSVEYYEKEEDIPWSGDKGIDSFLEKRLKLKEKKGNGIVVTAKLL